MKTAHNQPENHLTVKLSGGDEQIQVKLPELKHIPGHVLHGWVDDIPENLDTYHITDIKEWRFLHLTQIQQGHTAKSIRDNSTVFPEHWTGQKIVDAVAKTFEHPERYNIALNRDGDKYEIKVYKTVDNVVIKGIWQVDLQGNPVAPPYAYPSFGEDVKVIRDQRPIPLTEAQIRGRMNNYEDANQYQTLL